MASLIIGIAGGTGSGTTTLARKLLESLPDRKAALIEHDWYYRDRGHLTPAHRARVNFDEPDALESDLLLARLQALKAGQTVAGPQYDFATHTRRPLSREVNPRPVVVVEGIVMYAVPSLR